MSTTDLLNSGDLELYVYGTLSESDTKKIAALSKTDSEIKKEIISIEQSIIALSSSFSPVISSDIYEKVKLKVGLKKSRIVKMKPQKNWKQFMGWAAAILVLLGAVFQYNQLSVVQNNLLISATKNENLEIKNKETAAVLAIVRDSKNTVIALAGQAVSPKSFAKIYWNKETEVVYVDAAGLPEPPEGMVYQIWSLKLQPQLTPTSIGLLTEFTANNEKLFAVEKTADAEAFGITLEPAGGSKSPTMDQLYTLGKV